MQRLDPVAKDPATKEMRSPVRLHSPQSSPKHRSAVVEHMQSSKVQGDSKFCVVQPRSIAPLFEFPPQNFSAVHVPAKLGDETQVALSSVGQVPHGGSCGTQSINPPTSRAQAQSQSLKRQDAPSFPSSRQNAERHRPVFGDAATHSPAALQRPVKEDCDGVFSPQLRSTAMGIGHD